MLEGHAPKIFIEVSSAPIGSEILTHSLMHYILYSIIHLDPVRTSNLKGIDGGAACLDTGMTLRESSTDKYFKGSVFSTAAQRESCVIPDIFMTAPDAKVLKSGREG
jgi:hypothetical protein